jgi:hypothetical protein
VVVDVDVVLVAVPVIGFAVVVIRPAPGGKAPQLIDCEIVMSSRATSPMPVLRIVSKIIVCLVLSVYVIRPSYQLSPCGLDTRHIVRLLRVSKLNLTTLNEPKLICGSEDRMLKKNLMHVGELLPINMSLSIRALQPDTAGDAESIHYRIFVL